MATNKKTAKKKTSKKKASKKKVASKKVAAPKVVIAPAGGKSAGGKTLVGSGKVLHLDPNNILINSGTNPRIDHGDIAGLVKSVARNGVREPVTVKKVKGGYELVHGERRVVAAVKAKQSWIPAQLVKVEKDNDTLLRNLVSNDGELLKPVEEALAYRRLVEGGMTLGQIAKETGRPLARVKHRMDLISAHPDIVQAVKDGKISVHLGVDIARKHKKDPEKQKKLAAKASLNKTGKKAVAEELGKKDFRSMVTKLQVEALNRFNVLVEEYNGKTKDKKKHIPGKLAAQIQYFQEHSLTVVRAAIQFGIVQGLSSVLEFRSTKKKLSEKEKEARKSVAKKKGKKKTSKKKASKKKVAKTSSKKKSKKKKKVKKV